MSERIPAHGRPLTAHEYPDEYRKDLSPEAGEDQNVIPSQAEVPGYRTAYEAKDVHTRLDHIPDDEPKRIPLVPPGTRLRQGATYVDLASDAPGEFTATAEIKAGRSQRLVAKEDVDFELWNTLVGHTDRPRRGG